MSEASATDDPARQRILTAPVGRTVFRLGAPIALAMVFQVLFNLVDKYLIARLPSPLADRSLDAMGVCDMVAALGSIISYGISVATTSLMSRHEGRGERAEATGIAYGSLGLVTVLGLFFGAVALVGADVIVHDLLGAKGAVRELARDYLRVIMGGNLTVFMLYQLTAIQRALGQARGPLAVMVLANAVNLVLAVLLVYGPGAAPPVFAWGPPIAAALHLPRLELVGAAWATLLARSLGCVLAALLLLRSLGRPREGDALVPSRAIAKTIFDLAWPASAQFLVRASAQVAVVALVHHFYTTAKAVGAIHSDSAHALLAEVLLHFKYQHGVVATVDEECIVDVG